MTISRFERTANYVILVVFALVVLAPIGVAFQYALSAQSVGISGNLHFENFVDAWRIGRFSEYLTYSVEVAVIVVVIAVFCSIMAGYALGSMEFRGSQVVFYLFLLGIMIPTEAFIVPLFYDMRGFGLTDTVWGVALPQIAMSIAFGTYWMRTTFRSSNRSVIEAAKLDGAGSFRILWQVLVPISRPAILTLILLVFMWTWNEFLVALVMSPNAVVRTAPLGLALFKGQYTQGTALLAAGSILVALPVVVLYLFLQRHFIRGMLEGAVRE